MIRTLGDSAAPTVSCAERSGLASAGPLVLAFVGARSARACGAAVWQHDEAHQLAGELAQARLSPLAQPSLEDPEDSRDGALGAELAGLVASFICARCDVACEVTEHLAAQPAHSRPGVVGVDQAQPPDVGLGLIQRQQRVQPGARLALPAHLPLAGLPDPRA